MLCDICHEKEANNHIKQIVNGKITQMHLCNECASKQGYGDMFGAFNTSFNTFLSNMFEFPKLSPTLKRETESACPFCGQRFSDIVKSGKIGCAECYDFFCDKIMPNVRSIHGDTSHVGKIPISAGAQARRKSEIESLKLSLRNAVEVQEFEKAAELRDRIKELEGENDE